MKFLFFVIGLLIRVISFSQNDSVNNKSIPTIDGKLYQYYFEEYIHNHFDKELDSLGIEGVVLLKFKINKDGLLSDIECEPEVNKKLSLFFKEMLLSTDGKWTAIQQDTDSKKNNIIILPIYYAFQFKGKTKPGRSPDITRLLKNIFGDQSFEKKDFFKIIMLRPVEYISPYNRAPNKKINILMKRDSL